MITIHVKSIFSNLRRPRHGLTIPFDGEFVVLGLKGYINDLPRLIGGGIDEGEDPLAGASREFLEETGFEASLRPLVEVPIHAIADDGQTADTVVYCYVTELGKFKASDDLHGLVTMSLDEFERTTSEMAKLPDEWFDGKKGRMNWQDWGKFYHAVQSEALQALRTQR